MSLQKPEEGSESNTSSSDDLAHLPNLTRGAGEILVIRTIQRFVEPIFVPIFRPLIRHLVEERIGAAKQELLPSLKENPPKYAMASTSVRRRLKLKFRNRIGLPVFTGIPLHGENQTLIEIALVDSATEQIINTGTESTAKLEIMGFQVGATSEGNGWTFEEFQQRIISDRKGKRVLQGNTCLQLKDGVGFVHEIRFTHNSEHTKTGHYRLGAVVVDADLMKQVEGACTETFVVKDKRSTYYEKHPCPCLSDKVYHLQHIRYNGTRFKYLQDEKVETVRDLLILFYAHPKRLEDILELKVSSKIWKDIVKNAQASNGVFLYLDPSNGRKTGVVLDAKRQLKALIVEPHLYVPVDHLSEQQKVEVQDVVKFASDNLEMLDYFEDETSLKKHLHSVPGFTSLPSVMNESNHTQFVTSQSELVKETVPYDNELIYTTNYNQEHINTSDISRHAWEELEFSDIVDSVSAFLSESPNIECLSTVSVCTIAGTRWRKVSELLRRNSIRERISLSQGIQPLKKQKCCC